MYTTQPRIDSILAAFFANELERSGTARRRIEKVESRLRQCVEAEGDRMLSDHDFEVLRTERAFDRRTPIAHSMHAHDLLWVLAMFLVEPWRLSDPLALREQVRITDELTKHILRHRLVDLGLAEHPLTHIREGLVMARAELNRRPVTKARKRAPGRRS
jgi:hypothetical protein